MMSGRFGASRRDVLRLFEGDSVAGLGEGELLARFADRRDEAAFEALVGRLGPMVLGTCRRMLADPHDVDDAFQATFLILVRKAALLRERDLVGPWLHGVAWKVARRARADAVRRAARERLGSVEEAREADPGLEWSELRSRIDEEIGRLPEHQRRPLVLCDVEGMSREQAAQRLGWSLNMVRGRLARARERLRGRLVRRGMAPSGAWMVLGAPPPIPPPALVASTTRAALSIASGGAGSALATASAAALSRGVLRMMMLSKLKVVAAVALSAGVAGLMAVVAVAVATPGPIAAQDGPPVAQKVGRRLPDVAEDSTPAQVRTSALPNPGAPKPDLDAAPESVPVWVSGIVRDLDGKPVAGATVSLLAIQILTGQKTSSMKTVVAASTRTDKEGFYTVADVKIPTSRMRDVPGALTPFVQYRAVARAPGFGIGWHWGTSMYALESPDPEDIQGRLPLGSPAEMNVFLRPEADLKGRVVDEDGKPVAGIKVGVGDVMLLDERGMETTIFINLRPEEWPGDLGRAVTGADGRFRLPGLPSESCCWLFFERPGSKANRTLYASTSAENRTTHPDPEQHNGRGRHEVFPRDMEVSMPSPRQIEVRVVADDDGKPVPGVRVNSIGDTLATGTFSGDVADAEGRVTLDLPVGRYQGLYADPDSTDSRFIRTYHRQFEVTAEPQVQHRELRMKPGCELLVEAVDEATGQGVPDIHFEIRPEGLDVPWAAIRSSTFQMGREVTGLDGKLRAVLMPATGKGYRVRVLGAERGDPTVPAPPPLPGDGLPYDVTPKLSDPFEPTSGKTINLRFTLKKK